MYYLKKSHDLLNISNVTKVHVNNLTNCYVVGCNKLVTNQTLSITKYVVLERGEGGGGCVLCKRVLEYGLRKIWA